MSAARPGPLLTLEPLIDAIREGIEGSGWALSGLQKTTSHQFEGRWAGDSTRSAYLFFHPSDDAGSVSIDAYLDETSRGLAGNVALVVDLRPMGELGEAGPLLAHLGALGAANLPERYVTPVTLRYRLRDAEGSPGAAETEVRFKLRLPRTALEAGGNAVAALAGASVSAFEALLSDPWLRDAMLPG